MDPYALIQVGVGRGIHLRGLQRDDRGGWGWHKALVVGSVSLWRRLLASRLWTFCYDKQASVLPRASTCLGGGNPECNFCPWRPPLTP